MRVLIDAVHEGRKEARASTKPTRLTAEGVVGAVLSVLHARLSAGDARHNGGPQPMASLLGPLMAMIVLPYLGQSAAARETTRPSPRRRRAAPPVHGDPLRELDMRLTYRTVRVLLAIAELGERGSGPSNRRGRGRRRGRRPGPDLEAAARLEHLGLIENGGAGPRAESRTSGGSPPRALRSSARSAGRPLRLRADSRRGPRRARARARWVSLRRADDHKAKLLKVNAVRTGGAAPGSYQ